jgi:hypothetical protein
VVVEGEGKGEKRSGRRGRRRVVGEGEEWVERK